MKLFGRQLFERKKTGTLYDFAQHGIVRQSWAENEAVAYYTTVEDAAKIAEKGKKKKEPEFQLTPKGLHKLGSLNDNDFQIAIDNDYLDKALTECRQKLALLPKKQNAKNRDRILVGLGESGAVKFGREEIESIIERLENRKNLSRVEDTVEKYAHTSTLLINKVMKENSHLQFENANKFVPDFPKEAIEAMHEYNNMCKKICGKETVFYVIAQKKDFQEVSNRRDPILLAQSPFGFFWQILGAWDEEMVYLDEL